MKAGDTKNLMRIMARHLEYARCDYEDDFMKKIKNWQMNKRSRIGIWSTFLVNTRCDFVDDFMKKIKNWQFNPPADEKDEWPTEPRFNPLLHSTMISDTPDNEARPHFTKVR